MQPESSLVVTWEETMTRRRTTTRRSDRRALAPRPGRRGPRWPPFPHAGASQYGVTPTLTDVDDRDDDPATSAP
eukprot:8415545-Lingulodinium_polyedra.AAC.1